MKILSAIGEWLFFELGFVFKILGVIVAIVLVLLALSALKKNK